MRFKQNLVTKTRCCGYGEEEMKDSDNITCLKGIGEKTAKLLKKLGITTVKDLLYYYPRGYQSFLPPIKLSQAEPEEVITTELFVVSDFKWKKVRNLSIGTGLCSDGRNQVSITYFNAPYMKKRMSAGCSYLFRGKLKTEKGRYSMDQPKLYTREEYAELMGQLWPCYGLTAGLTNRTVLKAASQAIDSEAFAPEEYVPEELMLKYRLVSQREALRQIHFPKDWEHLLAARRRLVFDEFFLFLVSVRRMKEYNEASPTNYPMLETAWPGRLLEQLPFSLTGAQRRVWEEVKKDLTGGFCMNRLIQGDVGSGKTIVAFLALLLAVSNGFQGALMAPTELLAAQHFEQLMRLTESYQLPFRPALLTGSVSACAKKEIYRGIREGEVNVVIGTHALIQEKVTYLKLGLVITDEQHRFGVRQREQLNEKGGGAHVLVMSATPIPRTLAIILYGDMHLSVIDELPAGRLPVKNCVVGTSYRPKAYEFITKEIRKGNQAYVICPMVEQGEEETAGLENVTDYGERLKSTLPQDIHVEILHGKMKPGDKKRVMEAFAAGDVHVLVSTTVIEVGINVPKATVMMIENAERFGLAQLHQLRGRIGRGDEQSYCIFMNCSDSKTSMERLGVLNHSNDGFRIAEEDLKQRGPGDLFGIRQSGDMDFKIADIYQDADLLKEISVSVDELLSQGGLDSPQCEPLKRYLEENAGKFIDFRTI